MRGAVLITVVIAVGVMAIAAATVLFQRRLYYPVPADRPPLIGGYEVVTFTTADGLILHAWYRAPKKPAATVVFFHGNADSLAGAASATAVFASAGYGVLLPEYRGYAGNPGRPSEAGIYADSRAALGWLNARGTGPDQTVIIGNSVGSGPAVEMASEHRGAALIIVSGFTSLPAVVGYHVGVAALGALVFDKFDNAAKLAHIDLPVLILHGDADRVVPVSHAIRLGAAQPSAKVVLFSGIGHELAYVPLAGRAMLDWLATSKMVRPISNVSTSTTPSAS